MNKNVKAIAADAEKLGICRGDTVLVHSSLKSMGVPGLTPREVFEGRLEAIGDGTIVFPTLSYEYCNPGQRVFDVRTTPSNVGAIPEYFRTSFEGAIRSLCPTHSCAAYGRDAEYITCDQHLDTTPCGEHSPFRKLRNLNGKVLFLGCGCNCNTSMHAVEELVEPDYLYGDSYEYTLIDIDGKEHKMNCAAHGFKGVAQCYYRLIPMLPGDAYREGKILNADCTLVNAVPMWKIAEQKYREDPHCFIDIVGE